LFAFFFGLLVFLTGENCLAANHPSSLHGIQLKAASELLNSPGKKLATYSQSLTGNFQFRTASSDLPRRIEKRHKKTRVCKAFKAECHFEPYPCVYGVRLNSHFSDPFVVSVSVMEWTLRGPPVLG
jgi:hypothetical protein